jgi:hypothetical protein
VAHAKGGVKPIPPREFNDRYGPMLANGDGTRKAPDSVLFLID